MQVNNTMIGLESGCPQGINSDPAWSEKVYTPISNKLPLGKTLYCTTSTLQHLLFSNFAIAIFLFSATLCFEFVGLHQLISGKLVSIVLPNNPRL
jgi:hypothetical protein